MRKQACRSGRLLPIILVIKIPQHRFIIAPFENNNALNEAIALGGFDFTLTNPASAVEHITLNGAKPIATLVNKRQGLGYTKFGSVIFTRANRDDINVLEDIKGKIFIGVDEQGFGGWRVAWREFLNNNINPYTDFEELRFAGGKQQNVVYEVEKGNADAGSVRTDMLERLAASGKINLSDFKVIGARKTEGFPFLHSTALYPEWLFLSATKTTDILSRQVSEALFSISAKELAAINGKYVGWVEPLDYTSVDDLLKELSVGPYYKTESKFDREVQDLGLSHSERQWLNDHPTVSFTGDPNWLPYEAFDSQGNYIGIVAEHLRLISEMTGITFNISPSKTWTESTEKAKNGIVDILSETDDSDLKSYLTFTDPYLSNPIVITMRSSENFVEGISDIQNQKLALIKDYGYASKIRRLHSDIEFLTVADIQEGLIAVSTGEIDALLCTLALCSYTIAELGLNNVRIVGKTVFDTRLALGVQKHLPELVSILNKAIQNIRPAQQQSILNSWISQKFSPRTDYSLVYQVMVIAIFLIAIFVFWNRRLSKEVNYRKTIEEELMSAEEVLRISHQRLLLHREQSPLGVIEWNTNFEFIGWNEAAEKIFGFSQEEVIGRHITERILPESARQAVDIIWRDLLAKTGGERSTNENITKDGRTILCEWYNTPLVDQSGSVIGVASLVDDVTERTQSEKIIWKQANFDVLTDLPNRNMFHDRLQHEISRSIRSKLPLALMLLDLDQFKEVNDTLGHDVGDLLLQEAAQRIRACVRDSDTVARIGGDEFTIILPELHLKLDVDNIANDIVKKLSEAFHIGDEVIHISASIGITFYPTDADNMEDLIKNVDQTMYTAKAKGRNCYRYFTQSLQDEAQNRLRLTIDLRTALDAGQLEVYYQPIMELCSGRIHKAEALLRWHHLVRGMVSPVEFIPLAESSGLINSIGNWVFKESALKANDWSQRFESDFQVTVNMSPVQFKVDNKVFETEWLDYLNKFKLSGSNVVIEITEGLLLNVEPEVIDKLLWLRDEGIQVAIDDFGTGYSSLSYLRKFDIDYLKIDQSFVRNLGIDKNDIALSEAIIVMAHKLGLKVIAEGVETEIQKNMLMQAGCDYAQGYLYSKPVPSNEFESLLETM